MAKETLDHLTPALSPERRGSETAETPTAPVTEPFINKEEVARRLGKTLRTVDNWMQRGLLPYYKIGRSVEFKWSDVESHLSQTCRICRS
jgi:excisionase family DNA binding protein